MTPTKPTARISRALVVTIGEPFPSDCPARLYRARTDSGAPVLVSVVPPALAKSAVIEAGLPPVSAGPASSGDFYLAYDIPCGETLAERLRSTARLPWGVAARAFSPVAARLAELHLRDRAYGEMCPEELVFDLEGNLTSVSREVRKLSRSFERRRTPKPRMSVLPFMAPKRARGEYPTAESDVFTLGAILFNAIAGFVPFAGRGFLDQVHLVQTAEGPRLSQVDPKILEIISDVVSASLRKIPARRPSAEVVASALQLGIRRAFPEDLPWHEESESARDAPVWILSDGPCAGDSGPASTSPPRF